MECLMGFNYRTQAIQDETFNNLSQTFKIVKGVKVQAKLSERSGIEGSHTEQTAIMHYSPNNVSRGLG